MGEAAQLAMEGRRSRTDVREWPLPLAPFLGPCQSGLITAIIGVQARLVHGLKAHIVSPATFLNVTLNVTAPSLTHFHGLHASPPRAT